MTRLLTTRRPTRRDTLKLAAGAVGAAAVAQPAFAQSTPEASPMSSPVASPASSASATPGALLNEEFTNLISELMTELQVPGAVAGVVQGDTQEVQAYGTANLETGEAVTTDTLFQIGSITKTFTATALMQFIAEGKLSLDDTVQTHLPDFSVADPEASRTATIRNLVTHTSGWYGDPPEDNLSPEDTLESAIAKVGDLPQIAPVGGPFSYNNMNLVLLGRILEVVGDDTYENIIQQRVFDPLGLENAYFGEDEVRKQPHALGYATGQSGKPELQEPLAIPGYAAPAGGIFSTIGDVLEYGKFHAGTSTSGASVLADAQRQEMQQPLVEAGSLGPVRLDGIGVTWFTVEEGGVKMLLHAGGSNGQQCIMIVAPEQEFVFAIMTNSATGGGIVATLALQWVTANLLGSTAFEDMPGQPLDAELITSYFGSYTDPFGPTITIETAFVAEGPPRMAIMVSGAMDPSFLDSLEKDVWFETSPRTRNYYDFVRDETDAVAWMRVWGRLVPRDR